MLVLGSRVCRSAYRLCCISRAICPYEKYSQAALGAVLPSSILTQLMIVIMLIQMKCVCITVPSALSQVQARNSIRASRCFFPCLVPTLSRKLTTEMTNEMPILIP